MSKYLLTNSRMYPIKENQEIYNQFIEFKKTFFEDGVSFFDPEIKLFDTDEVFIEFEKRIITNYDSSKRKNRSKYQEQLTNASKKMRHFFANIIWLYNFPIADKNTTTKREEIKTYLAQFCDHQNIDNLVKKTPIASYGRLSQYIYFDINLIYFFTKIFIKTKKDPNDILNNLDLYSFMKDLTNENFNHMNFLASRHMLNYLFNPDKYEPIVNTTCKRNIVKFFLGKFNNKTIDQDLFKIRNDSFGFENSLYSEVCGNEFIKLKNQVKIISKKINSDKKDNLTLKSKNYKDNDPLTKNKTRIENGDEAELLVYKQILPLINKAVFATELVKYFDNKDLGTINHNIEKLIHYSKNYDYYAPFDLISTQGQELLFIEVKSTKSNEIYFSINEIIFAYNHINNYQLKVVKNSKIYDLDIEEEIIDIFQNQESNDSKWNFQIIKFNLEFNNKG